MKLTLEHLAPYLPYRLKFLNKSLYGKIIVEMNTYNILNLLDDSKPILRPLSDLFNGDYEFILDEFSEWDLEIFKTTFLSELRPLNAFDKINYTIVLLLLKNHFDIFGLIGQDLAIDINTLAQYLK